MHGGVLTVDLALEDDAITVGQARRVVEATRGRAVVAPDATPALAVEGLERRLVALHMEDAVVADGLEGTVALAAVRVGGVVHDVPLATLTVGVVRHHQQTVVDREDLVAPVAHPATPERRLLVATLDGAEVAAVHDLEGLHPPEVDERVEGADPAVVGDQVAVIRHQVAAEQVAVDPRTGRAVGVVGLASAAGAAEPERGGRRAVRVDVLVGHALAQQREAAAPLVVDHHRHATGDVRLGLADLGAIGHTLRRADAALEEEEQDTPAHKNSFAPAWGCLLVNERITKTPVCQCMRMFLLLICCEFTVAGDDVRFVHTQGLLGNVVPVEVTFYEYASAMTKRRHVHLV